MRLNKYIALATGISRRVADDAIAAGKVTVNDNAAELGQHIDTEKDVVKLGNKPLTAPEKPLTIMLNKPAGYVCSRDGQGSKTIYDLIPEKYHQLKPVGRLDKDSSGLILLTNDGTLAFKLTHPSFQKEKVYEVRLDKPLTSEALHSLDKGVMLEDGISKLGVRAKRQVPRDKKTHDSYLMTHDSAYEVRMSEGRNRQIRRTFEALGYKIKRLHRNSFGPYELGDLRSGGANVV